LKEYTKAKLNSAVEMTPAFWDIFTHLLGGSRQALKVLAVQMVEGSLADQLNQGFFLLTKTRQDRLYFNAGVAGGFASVLERRSLGQFSH